MAKSTKKKANKKKAKEKKVSYHRQPEELTLREWQISLRKQYGKEQEFQLTNEGEHPVWSDFIIHNATRNSNYRLALRGQEVGQNYCSCFDFRVSGLGTCKHIEWALFKLANTYGNKQYFRKPPPEQKYTSVFIHYGESRTVRIRIGTEQAEAFSLLAETFFDKEGVLFPYAYLEFDRFLHKAQAISSTFRCYSDVLEFVVQKREDARRAKRADRLLADPKGLTGLIKADLYPYQQEGVAFAFKAGRSLIADEMGLGKTIQAIATAQLYQREYGISSVYIICPTSLKYQWRAEIKKFTDSTVKVIEGPMHKRREQYEQDPSFYKILTYNVVARDYPYLNAADPDFIILDEAQRIKNWDTKISRAVKRLKTPFRLALTGTPLENKLEDLYSIVQFLDQFLLGPLYLLQYRHQAKDEHGMVHGYRNLNQIYHKLKGVMLRRRKKDVLKQLPERLDQNLFVPMTARQMEVHRSYEADVAQLIAKWRRHNFLSEKDRLRLMSCLQLMRMSCDSTYLVDQKFRHDTKIDELFYILEERLSEPGESAVIFSQWERMTRIVAEELEQRDIPFAYLHGGVPSKKRGALLDRFREDESCRVFLSTDAGGVGLNLQKASLIVNLDLPWNPAVLEQRIGRVYRLGQDKGVQVVNLISEGTIEHRMLYTLKFKSSLAEAVLDTAEDSVFMSDRKFKDFMEKLEKVNVTDTQSETPAEASSDENLERIPASATPDSVEPEFAESLVSEWWEEEEDTNVNPLQKKEAEGKTEATNTGAPRTPSAARDLLSQGVSFLSRLSQTLTDEKATQTLVNELVKKDEASGETYLKIPVENAEVVQNAVKLLGGLLGKL
ncbi:MAG: DEAD/DEAH box helicase [Saprospiraceae bacterium]|nr:DEAD/DEAH box helicase [Saprospiraceae bacterium]